MSVYTLYSTERNSKRFKGAHSHSWKNKMHTKQLYVSPRQRVIEVTNTWDDIMNTHCIALGKGDCARETTREGFKEATTPREEASGCLLPFSGQEDRGSILTVSHEDEKECSLPRTIASRVQTGAFTENAGIN